MALPLLAPPPDCGRRLLPALIDHVARTDPSRPFVSIPRSTDPEAGFEDVSFALFAEAVDRAAGWIKRELGLSSTHATLAYLGPLDLRYPILLLAALKTGHKAFFPSPRNSIAAHLSLLRDAQCTTFLVPDPVPAPVQQILAADSTLRTVSVPSLDHLLVARQPGQPAPPHFPIEKPFDQARHDPFVLLHTSGSTGIPKLVAMTHGTFAAMDAHQLIPWQGAKPTVGENWRGLRLFLGFPLFHAATLSCLLGMGVYWQVTWVLAPLVPLTAAVADRVHRFGNVQGSALPPSVLVDLCKDSGQADRLCQLDQIIFGGGPLPTPTGDYIASRTRLTTAMGSTETAILPMEIAAREDWNFLSYSPQLGHEFWAIPETAGLYELVIVRASEYDLFQAVFATFPHLDCYPTGDTYTKHPHKDHLWQYQGRRDDVIAFSNGEKLNPVTMESIIAAHDQVSVALIGRHGAFQSSLLVEPKLYPASSTDAQRIINDIWPTVQKANQDCPAHGRLVKDLILIATPDKPFPRSAKNTVQRKLAIELYRPELDRLYAAASADDTSSPAIVLTGDWTGLSTTAALLRLIETVTGISHLSSEQDFFTLGVDSLQVVTLARYINVWLSIHRPNIDLISSKVIYRNPSVAALQEVLELTASSFKASKAVSRATAMQATLAHLASPSRQQDTIGGARMHVVLTGSTGALGTHLLSILAMDPQVVKVHCLDRDKNASASQSKLLADNFGKVVFHYANISQDRLGLPQATYEEIASAATHIFHTAWDANTNLSLASYQSTHLQAVQNVAILAQATKKRAALLFTSSFETVNNWNAAGYMGAVPEALFEDWALSRAAGSAEAKAVAERVLATFSGVRTIIVRLAQLAGPAASPIQVSNRDAWVPRMIASSLHLGKIPSSLGPFDEIDWLPVDVAANVLCDLMRIVSKTSLGFSDGGATVRHVANYHRVRWADILRDLCPRHPSVKPVPLAEWVASLKESALDISSLRELNPAAKLVSFFEELRDREAAGEPCVRLDIRNAKAESETLQKLQPTDAVLMRLWMEQWGFVGIFEA